MAQAPALERFIVQDCQAAVEGMLSLPVTLCLDGEAAIPCSGHADPAQHRFFAVRE
jgi:hypothetical protein